MLDSMNGVRRTVEWDKNSSRWRFFNVLKRERAQTAEFRSEKKL